MTVISPTASNSVSDLEANIRANPVDSNSYQQDVSNVKKPSFSLSTLLRLFGACAVIASLSLFLLEGWTEGNDLSRYLKLLGQTGLITGAGIFLSHIIKEAKGARLFFGLGLVSAVANFTILGALTYSIFQLDNRLGGESGSYPSMLQWQALEMSAFLPVALATILLLSLLARFSFTIFARQNADKLTAAFLGLNTLLLIPARDAVYVSALAAIALLGALHVVTSIIKDKQAPLTPESKYAYACLFLPGLIIVSRALGLYAVDEIVLLTLFSLVYYTFRNISGMLSATDSMQKPIAFIQYLTSVIVGLLLAALLPHSIDMLGSAVFSFTVIAATCDLANRQLMADSKITTGPNKASFVKALIAITTIGTALINVGVALDSSGLMLKITGVITAIALFAFVRFYSHSVGDMKGSQLVSLMGLAATGLILIGHLVSLINIGSWALIGGLGISLIVIASLYERFGFSLTAIKRNTAE